MLQTIKNKIKNILLPSDPDLHYGNTLHKLSIEKSKNNRLALHLELTAGSNILLDYNAISECLSSGFDLNKNNSNFNSKHFVTGLESLYVDESTKPILVGERTNVLGSKRFKRLIENDDFDQASEIGKLQINSGANVLDVCLQNTDRNEIDDIKKFLENFMLKKNSLIWLYISFGLNFVLNLIFCFPLEQEKQLCLPPTTWRKAWQPKV